LNIRLVVLLAGCDGDSCFPTPGEMELMACRRAVRSIGCGLEKRYPEGPFPKQLPEVLATCCPATRQSLAYEVSSDLKAFRVYCRGEVHRKVGVPAGYPLYASGKGVESFPGEQISLPPGFPDLCPLEKLLVSEARPDGTVVVEAEIDLKRAAASLTKKLGQPLGYRGDPLWRIDRYPRADKLTVKIQRSSKLLWVDYSPSHLSAP